MAAPKGHQLWRLRSTHGRDKLFATAQLLQEAAEEYFQWCDEHPWVRQEWVGKNAEEVERKLSRPYTYSGLCIYLGCSESYFRTFKHSLKGKTDEASLNFLAVLEHIAVTMYNQKFEGAAVGAFNPMIISRDLGLRDNTSIDIVTTKIEDESEEDLMRKLAALQAKQQNDEVDGLD